MSVSLLEFSPQVRLELTTLRLTAECSAIELLRNIVRRRILRLNILPNLVKPTCEIA